MRKTAEERKAAHCGGLKFSPLGLMTFCGAEVLRLEDLDDSCNVI